MFPIGIADSLNSPQPLPRFYRTLHSSFDQYLDCYFERSIGPEFYQFNRVRSLSGQDRLTASHRPDLGER
jgi:hypothetical protein